MKQSVDSSDQRQCDDPYQHLPVVAEAVGAVDGSSSPMPMAFQLVERVLDKRLIRPVVVGQPLHLDPTPQRFPGVASPFSRPSCSRRMPILQRASLLHQNER